MGISRWKRWDNTLVWMEKALNCPEAKSLAKVAHKRSESSEISFARLVSLNQSTWQADLTAI